MSEELAEYRNTVERYRALDSFARPVVDNDNNQIDLSDNDDDNVENLFLSDDNIDMLSNDDEEIHSDDEINVEDIEKQGSRSILCDNLAKWAIRNKIPHAHINDLLAVLKESGIRNLPCSAQSLLKTPAQCLKLRNISSGEYYHYGIKNALSSNQFYHLKNYEAIEIDIGIDGVSLFKSSKRELWPIIGSVVNGRKSDLFLIGCYSGFSKPNDINDFLKDLADEIKFLQNNGIKTNVDDNAKPFQVRLFICDAPARAFVTGCTYHTGKNSCPKCMQKGSYSDHKVVFELETRQPRTDDNFLKRVDKDYHQQVFLNTSNVLETIGIGMVSQFPVEPMHLVDLGIVRKMLIAMCKNKTGNYKCNIREINSRLMRISNHIPCEFARNQRTLEHLFLWKATEFRTFLMYTGVVVLKGAVHDDLYYHFLLLHSSIRILSCKHSCSSNLQTAREMIKEFVRLFPIIYGENNISFNVHCLLHLCDSAEQYGTLDSFSAYKFENFNQYLKRLIRSPNKILQQIYKRLQEGIVANSYEYAIETDEFKIRVKEESDSYCLMKPNKPIKVAAVGWENEVEVVVGNVFHSSIDFFEEPVKSSEGLGILLCSDLETEKQTFKKTDIIYKYFPVHVTQGIVLIPLLHHCFRKFHH